MSDEKPKMRLSYTDLKMRRDSIDRLQVEVERERSNSEYERMKLPVADKSHHDYLVKLLIIGDSSVGKSCLLLRFCDDSFTPSFITTVGIDFKIRTIELDGEKVKLQIWDTAGQERFRTITTAYYRGAMGIIFAYDVTKKESFEHMEQWMKEVLKLAASDVDKMLVGCKCDLENERTVGKKSGMVFAEEHRMQFLEVSAKENINVDRCFIDITRRVKSRLVSTSQNESEDAIRVLNTPRGGDNSKGQSKCCK